MYGDIGEGMKVVKNACYGGFEVSRNATQDLVDMGCEHIEISNLDEYFGKHVESLDDIDPEMMSSPGTYRSQLDFFDKCYNFEKREIYEFKENARTCPHLIKLIEEKGSEYCSKDVSHLVIVEIPDGACYEIEEYDGMESIVECHKVFG